MKKLANRSLAKQAAYARRKHRVNVITKTTSDKPRLIVNRSLKHISAQIIDTSGKVLAVANDTSISSGTKSEKAFQVGEKIAAAAKKAGVETVVFDRNGFLYHGRVAKLAEGARSGGLVM